MSAELQLKLYLNKRISYARN
uniref:Uncharacterized protein n=1 Tax=Arundo donax TaxID=35708 RepID=A0A0A9A2L1_ARUDO